MLLGSAESDPSPAGLLIAAAVSIVLFWIPLYLVGRLMWTKRKLKKQRAQHAQSAAGGRQASEGSASRAIAHRSRSAVTPAGGVWTRAVGDTIPDISRFDVVFETAGHIAVGRATPGSAPYAVGNGAVAILKDQDGQIALGWAIAGSNRRQESAGLFGPMGVNNIVYSAATEAVFIQWQDRSGRVADKDQRLLHFASVAGAGAFAGEILKIAPNAESNL